MPISEELRDRAPRLWEIWWQIAYAGRKLRRLDMRGVPPVIEITGEILYNHVVHSVMAFQLGSEKWDIDTSCGCNDPKTINSLERYVECTGMTLDPNKRSLASVLVGGKRVYPQAEEWREALQHAAVALTHAPYHAHNWVHFHFVDACIAAFTEGLLDGCPLAQALVFPHTRYTLSTNQSGLGGIVSEGVDTSQFFRAVTPILSTAKKFNETARQQTSEFYSSKTLPCGITFSIPLLYRGAPMGLWDSSITTPYLQAQNEAYVHVLEYVTRCMAAMPEGQIEALWKCQTHAFSLMHTRDESGDIADFVATFIWIVSFCHSVDHGTAASLNQQYGVPQFTTLRFGSTGAHISSLCDSKGRIVSHEAIKLAITPPSLSSTVGDNVIQDRELRINLNRVKQTLVSKLGAEDFPIYASICN